VQDEPRGFGSGGDPLGQGFSAGLVGGPTPVQSDDRPLVLDAEPGGVELPRIEVACEAGRRPGVRAELRRGARLGAVREQQLEPVVADVGQLLEPDDPPGDRRAAAADDRDGGVAVGDPGERDAGLVGNGG